MTKGQSYVTHLAGRKFQEIMEAARAAPPGKNYAALGDLAVFPS